MKYQEAIFWTLCFGIFFLAWHIGDQDPHTIKSYVINCHSYSKATGDNCPGDDWRHQDVEVYYVWVEQQRVVELTDDGQVYKYDKCEIATKEDWSCDLSDQYSSHGISSSDGTLRDSLDPVWIRRVGPVRYYWDRFLDLFQS